MEENNVVLSEGRFSILSEIANKDMNIYDDASKDTRLTYLENQKLITIDCDNYSSRCRIHLTLLGEKILVDYENQRKEQLEKEEKQKLLLSKRKSKDLDNQIAKLDDLELATNDKIALQLIFWTISQQVHKKNIERKVYKTLRKLKKPLGKVLFSSVLFLTQEYIKHVYFQE